MCWKFRMFCNIIFYSKGILNFLLQTPSIFDKVLKILSKIDPAVYRRLHMR